MGLTSKQLEALQKVFKSVGRPDLLNKILNAQGKKQRHDAVAYGFKVLTSKLPKDDIGVLRQLREMVTQIDNEELRQSIELILGELFSSEQKSASVPARIGARILRKQRPLRFDLTPKQQQKPRAFNWNRFHRGKVQ